MKETTVSGEHNWDSNPTNDDYNAERIENERLEMAKNILNIVSFIVLLITCLIWAVIYYVNRHRQAWRYLMLLFFFVSCLVAIIVEIDSDTYVYPQTVEQIVLFTLTAYGAMCMVRAVNRVVTVGQVGLCILSIILLALFLNGLEFGLVRTEIDLNTIVLDIVLVDVPRLVALAAGLVISVVLLYWLFYLDNTKYRDSKDYRIIRHSTVCLLVALLVCASLEVVNWLHKRDGHSVRLSRTDVNIFYVCLVVKNLMFCLLFCFLDLEFIALFPCLDLDEGGSEYGESRPLNNTAQIPAKEMTFGPDETPTHVSTFETEITPRPPIVPSVPAYGAVPK